MISSYTVQNSKEFANFITNQKLDPGEHIVSFDVISLFTSIPVDLALQIVKEELAITPMWTLHTNLTAEQICNLLKCTLSNNFFVFDDCHYHQIFGCPMGSPVSAVAAELVMQRIEKVALDSSPVPARWWKRYVDDSNNCLKQLDVPLFHQHLNSVNSHIQFTIKMPAVKQNGSQTIAFLDTQLLGNISGNIDVKVFRKNTHTDKYSPFESHSHKNDKKAVIKTLLDRAKTIPSTSTLQTEEIENVLRALDGYKKGFIKEVVNDTVKVNQKGKEDLRGSICIPYVKGVWEKIKSILTKAGVRVALKLVYTLANILHSIPKTRPSEERTKAVVYKFECRTCSLTYIGESKRCWCSTT